MAVKTTERQACTCERCGHGWVTRGESLPERCPRCNSPYWQTARRDAVKAPPGRMVRFIMKDDTGTILHLTDRAAAWCNNDMGGEPVFPPEVGNRKICTLCTRELRTNDSLLPGSGE